MRITFAMLGTDLAGGVRYVFEVSNRLKGKGRDVKILSLLGDHEWFKGLNVKVIYKQPRYSHKIAEAAYKLFMKHISSLDMATRVENFDPTKRFRQLDGG